MKLKFIIIFQILFIPLLLVRVQLHLHDVESYINNISRIDKNHDYDRDGQTESRKQCGSILKVQHLVMFLDTPIQIKQSSLNLIGHIQFPDIPIQIPDFLVPPIDQPPKIDAFIA